MINRPSQRQSNRFLPALIILLVPVGSMLSVAAQASTIIRIAPQTISMEIGEKAYFSVEIINAENLFGFELHISYDPTMVQVVDADPSKTGIQLFPGDMYEVEQGFIVANEADNEIGKALFVFTLLSPAPPLAGDGTLVRFELEAIGEGTNEIILEEVILASPDGEALPFVAMNGDVIIELAPEETPSFTDTPPQQLSLTATMTISPAETMEAFSSASPLPMTLLASSTLIPAQEMSPAPSSTVADVPLPSQVNQTSKAFGLVILAVVILMLIGGAWFLVRRLYSRE